MDTNRRNLLHGLSATALLARYFDAGASAGTTSSLSEEHMKIMTRTLGAGLNGQEQVAMLLYPRFTALDLVGPHYFFACLLGAQIHLVTTEKDLTPVPSDLGLAITPTVTMADTPRDLDVLLLPGGTDGTVSLMRRADTMTWISDRAARARYVTSVCTGSMILAKAGVLKGRKATSHWVARPILADFGAHPTDQRVIRDGNVITSAGVSAGIDLAITLVEILRGRPYAESLMLQAEYAPEPPFSGGTPTTTPREVTATIDDMFAPIAAQLRALAGNSHPPA